jgi:large subunit ribosomal protein L1
VHATIGKVDFDVNRLEENLGTFLEALKRSKPPSSKGTYIKKVSVSTTMGIGMAVAI